MRGFPVFVYTTFPSLDDAKRVGDALVAAQARGLRQHLPRHDLDLRVERDAREVADEVAMIVKTRAVVADAVLAEAKRLHPYEVPALIVLPTQGGSAEYCGWIAAQTQARFP